MDYQPPVSPTPIASTPSAKPIAPTPDYWKAAEKAANSRAPKWMSEMPSSHPGIDTFKKLPSMVDVMGKEYVRPRTIFSSGIGRDGVQYSEPSAKVIPGYTREVVVGRAVVRPDAAPTIGSQVGSGALKAANIAGIGYGGFVDYQSGIAQGESQFRSGTNAFAGMGGAYAGGVAGAQLGAAAGAALGSAIPGAGTAAGGIVGGFIGGIGGSIAGSGVAGWASDRFLDLFGGPKSIPNPNGPTGNPFSPRDPFGPPSPSIPQPTGQQLGAPPGGGSGMGMPQGQPPTNPSAGNPFFPRMPWDPGWKPPRMPWEPQTPEKPTPDPKKPAKPGNPPGPNGGKPIPKPETPPIVKVPGIWRTVVTGPGDRGMTWLEGVDEKPGFSFQIPTVRDLQGYTGSDRGEPRMELSYDPGGPSETYHAIFYRDRQAVSYGFIPYPTPENTRKPDDFSKGKPEDPWPRPETQPPDGSRPGTPDSGFPGDFSRPGSRPDAFRFVPSGSKPDAPNIGYVGDPGLQGGNPGNQKDPSSQSGPDPDQRMPGARPTGETPATNSGTAPQNSPASQQSPTLQRSPAQNPTANSPQIRTPGNVPKGNSTTSYESPTFDQWVKNNPAPWNNPETAAPTASLDIKTPSTATTTGNPFSSPNTGFTKPSTNIPANIPLPIGAQIPANAIPQPIISPGTDAPSTSCNYKPDATITVGLASYNPLTDSITYTPTLVSASNAAGFQHLAQETANMRKEVSGIHKVLEVDLYRSPTGKIVAPKAEVEVLQAVMSVSPMAAVPLIKTLPQEMKVLAAMNHMYSGHHLLGNIKVSSNPANAKAATYAPLTAVGMQFALYNNVTSMIGLPNAVSTVNAKGASIATPFLNSLDAIENVNATTQGLETDISGIQEMLFKVLQNQEMAINMIHKETFKTEVLIKDTGCRITEIPVQRPSVMSHGNAKTPVKKGFNWLNVFTGSTTFTNVPVWKGDIDKQQLGLKTNMEAQKANTSVYFPIADNEQTKLPNLQTRPKKGNEFNRFVKTLNESPPNQGDAPSIYDGPGLPKAKLEEVILGNVKKIVVESDVEFIGVSPPLAGVKKGNKAK